MKSFEELSNRFESIPNLPVSEEILGAYLENNLSVNEAHIVEDTIENSSAMTELLSSSSLDSTDLILGNGDSILDGVLDWLHIDLPQVGDVLDIPSIDSNIYSLPDSPSMDDTHFPIGENFSSDGDIFDSDLDSLDLNDF